MSFDFRRFSMSVPWNLFLLTVGGLLYVFGLKAFAAPHGFISGGLFGLSMFLDTHLSALGIGVWYAILCVPVALASWFALSRRFVLYSLYGMAVTTIGAEFITYSAPVTDPLLAAIAGGTVIGVGVGVMLRSFGSDGGLTLVSMILHQKYNIKVGGVSLAFNIVLFACALTTMDINLVLYTVIMVYIYSGIMDYSMEFTNQRKMVLVISDTAEKIAGEIMDNLHRGVTYLYTKGAYTNQERYVVLTVVHNHQLKRLEELVYTTDPNAFLIIENTYNVLGRGFSARRVY